MIQTPNRRNNPEQQLLLAAHMARQLPGDQQVLDDALLQQVLQGERRLTATQYRALVASPITLSRLRFLESQRLAAAAALADPQAATPGGQAQRPHWQRSPAELKAASGIGTDCSLESPDGLWALHALTTGTTTWLKLQLRRGTDGGQPGLQLEPDIEVAVLDGSGGTLLLGRLDDDGELEAVWARPLDLRSHLAQHGGTWTVERA